MHQLLTRSTSGRPLPSFGLGYPGSQSPKRPSSPLPSPVLDGHNSNARTPTSSYTSAMDHIKRGHIVGLGKSKEKAKDKSKDKSRAHSGDRSHSKAEARPINKLDVIWESPPNILYGKPADSSGALMSGLIRLTVVDTEITLDEFGMELINTITSRKPVSHGCPDCTTQKTTLNTWTFIKSPRKFEHGEHTFPFSYLLPGDLPATTQGYLASLTYSLEAKALASSTSGSVSTSTEKSLPLSSPVPIYRAIKPSQDKNSLRIFPPTNLTAHMTAPPTIHPIGAFGAHLRISGVVEKQKDMEVRWRLRKLIWKLEETEKMVSPACLKHQSKVGGPGKGVLHEDTRIIGTEEIKEGWKTDFPDNVIEMDFSYRALGAPRPLCDVASPTGLSVTHALIVELIVAEEWATLKRPEQPTPTGAARVLRMQFPMVVTERAGMGISWDEEQPPMYEDVPPSPPLYAIGQKQRPGRSIAVAFDTPGGTSMERNPSATGRAETFDYTGPPLDTPAHGPTTPGLEEVTERLSLGEAAAGPSRSAGLPPSARGRFALEDFETDESDRRGRAYRERAEEGEEEGTPADEERGVGVVE